VNHASSAKPVLRDRLFREVFEERPLTVAEAGPVTPPPLEVALRPYPFPFKAGLAISNDTRSMTRAVFDEVHGALAERGLETEAMLSFGAGDLCGVGTRLARELFEAGLARSVTGLPEGGVAAAVQALDSAAIAPACFIGESAVGAASGMTAAGVRYFSDDAFLQRAKFGEAMDYRSTLRLSDAFATFSYDDFGEGGTDLAAAFAAREHDGRRTLAVQLFNHPLVTIDAPDGARLQAFKRFRGDQRPAATTLGFQIRSQFMDALQAFAGAVIVEQRFGEMALLGQSPENEQRHRADDKVLGGHELVALDDLAARASDQILVTTPPRLLDWLQLRSGLRFETDRTDDVWLVRLTGLVANGCSGPVSRSQLDGLALLIPRDAPKVVVLVEGETQPLDTRRDADPAFDGHDCVFLTWGKRQWSPR
jgi:hypothetical protein